MLIIAASRFPIFGSGVDIGAPIGGAEVSDIPIAGISGVGAAPAGVAPSRWDLIICINWSEGTPIIFPIQLLVS